MNSPVEEHIRMPDARTKPANANEKASFAANTNEACEGWLTGLEPAASRTTICGTVVLSPSLSRLTATEDSRCTTGCTSKTKKARRSRSKAVADTAPAAAVESSEGGFAKALLMIALLPLSDAEKADAVRRLMADQATGPVCGR